MGNIKKSHSYPSNDPSRTFGEMVAFQYSMSG